MIRLETTGTVETTTGWTITDPIISITLYVMEGKLATNIVAYSNVEEEAERCSVLLRTDATRIQLPNVEVDMDTLLAVNVGDSILDIVKASAKTYLESQLNVTIV